MTTFVDREVAFVQSPAPPDLEGYAPDPEGYAGGYDDFAPPDLEGVLGVDVPTTSVERTSKRNPQEIVTPEVLSRVADAFPLIRGTKADIERELGRRPEITFRILNDIYEKVTAADERKLGVLKPGRRVKVKMTGAQLREHALGLPPSMDPFPRALKELMGDRSQVTFARLMGTNQSTVSRLLSGQKQPDRYLCERAAEAGNVPPWYFREWRTVVAAEWVQQAMEEHPNVSLRLVTHFVGVV